MKYTASQYATTLYEELEAHPKDVSGVIKKFAGILVLHGRSGLLRAICTEFERVWYIRREITPVEVVSADKGAVNKREIEKLVGREIELMEKIDPRIIAGARVTIGDWRIDNTLERRIADLREAVSK